MHHQSRGTTLENSEKYYKNILKKDFKNYPSKEKMQALSATARTDKSDLWIQRDPIMKHFKRLTLSEFKKV